MPGAAETVSPLSEKFVDRRDIERPSSPPGVERRQFTNSHEGLAPDAEELAKAIDQYKIRHRRRFITCDEILSVVKSLGYHK